jgi:DNA-binding response OmpR family regulator
MPAARHSAHGGPVSETTRVAAPGQSASILLVDGDRGTARLLREALEPQGLRIWHAQNAAEAALLADEIEFDVILLDIALPGANGLALCPELRQRSGAPIIACSRSKRRDYAVLALKLGASDFVAKPFYLPELEARIELVRRRGPPRRGLPGAWNGPQTPQRLGALVIDRANHRVALGGRPLHLTPTEYWLLEALASRSGQVVPHAVLLRAIWGHDDPALVDALGVHARRLRGKLRREAAVAPSVVSVRGFGYRLV